MKKSVKRWTSGTFAMNAHLHLLPPTKTTLTTDFSLSVFYVVYIGYNKWYERQKKQLALMRFRKISILSTNFKTLFFQCKVKSKQECDWLNQDLYITSSNGSLVKSTLSALFWTLKDIDASFTCRCVLVPNTYYL